MPSFPSARPVPRPRCGRPVLTGVATAALALPALGVAAQAAPGAEVVPAAPTDNAFVSDLEWVSESNGLGPVERDTAVGGEAAGDGGVMTLGGLEFDKGLGVHADSAVRLHLGAQCWSFRSYAGVDDSRGARGSVTFAVVGDGETLAATPTLTGASAPERLDVDVSGVDYLDLVVDKVDDDGDDHANWAYARLVCGDVLVTGTTEPTVVDGPGTADFVTIPAVEGAEYVVNDVVLAPGEHPVLSETIGVVVRAISGYQLDPDIGAPSWAFAFDRWVEPTEDPTDGATATPTGEEPTAGPSEGPAEPSPQVPTRPATGSTTGGDGPGAGAGTGGDGPPPAGELPRTGGGTGPAAAGALGLLITGALATTLAVRRRANFA